MKSNRQPKREGPEGLFTKAEKMRLVVMVVVLIGVAAALITSIQQENKLRSEDGQALPIAEQELVHKVEVPEIDRARLAELTHDADEEERRSLDRDAVGFLVETCRTLTPRHFAVMGVRDLDPSAAKSIVSDPAPMRGDALRARGWLRDVRERQGLDGKTELHGRLTLEEDGTTVYFVAVRSQRGFELEPDVSFVRVDGLLCGVYSNEVQGSWSPGPLLVAPSIERSYPASGAVEVVDELRMVTGVVDDSIEDGITGLPFDEFWHLMAHARDVPSGSVDWEAIPELNPTLLGEVLEQGHAHRAEPIRLPVSKIMGLSVRPADENPARIERTTQGWIGNYQWARPIHFYAPFPIEGMSEGDLASAHGFFFKNFAYESSNKGLQVAPVFVLQSIERFVPVEDHWMGQLFVGVAAMCIGLGVALFLLVRRDRRRSEELQAALVRRRRARRAQQA